jgi:uncharacterized protein YuzE
MIDTDDNGRIIGIEVCSVRERGKQPELPAAAD